jgi:hypothetical protein
LCSRVGHGDSADRIYQGVRDFMKVRLFQNQPNFWFMGWEFLDIPHPDEPGVGQLLCFVELENPENGANLSYSNYGRSRDREASAAWLIGHWFEHKFITCPCQHGDGEQGKPVRYGLSRIGYTVMESLLSYHAVLSSGSQPAYDVEALIEEKTPGGGWIRYSGRVPEKPATVLRFT